MNNELEIVVDGVIYHSQPRGGISRLFSEILPRMCEADDSLHISLLTQGQLQQPLPEHPRIRHCPVTHIERYLRPRRLWNPVIPAVRRLMLRLRTGTGAGKIWHSTYYTRPEKWDGYSVVTVHDMIFERFPELYNSPGSDRFREEKRRCIMEADAVICVSETTKQETQQLYNLDPPSIYVVPHACSDAFKQTEDFDDISEIPIDQPFLLYIGRRSRYKNFDLLIQAYHVWSKKNDVALVLVGGRQWSDDEQKRLAELGIQGRVHILENITDQILCYLYNKAVGFVYPSLYEGFGIPLLEAMACGCPIIASRIPSTVEVAGQCPIYFEPTEANDLLNALDIALSEGCNSERVQAGLERVKTYSWDKTAAETLKVYQAVCT